MARPSGGTELPVEGMLARIKRGVGYAFTGASDWFGPGQPQPPQAPAAVEGRQWQVPIGVNTVQTKKTEGIDFHTLRVFADAVDIVRLLIEQRKDELCQLDWTVQKKGTQGGLRKQAPKDKRSEELEAFLKLPDRDHTWDAWLRLLLEDMYVLDAASLYVQKTKGGKLYALRPIDGGTIKRVIDGRGWTPEPPLPAYQQILRGVVATNYATDELRYLMRNQRTNRMYGYSHVEQIIVTARVWLARQASNLEYYDKGSIPDGFLSASKDWGTNEIKRYQDMFDEQLSGQLGERRKVKITPPDSKFTATKEPALKSEYDEWLARIACFCFSVSPQPFIKEMNRATAQTNKTGASETGLERDRKWVQCMMTRLIESTLEAPDYEFVFRDQEAQDPLQRAQIDQIYVNAGVLMPDEVRGDLGLEPLPNGQGASPRQPVTPGAPKEDNPDGEDEDEPEPAGKVDHDHLRKVDDSPLTPPMKTLKDAFTVALGEVRDALLKAANGIAKAAGGDGNPPQPPKKGDEWWFALTDKMDLSGLSLAYDDYNDTVVAVTNTGARLEVARLVAHDPSVQDEAAHAGFGSLDHQDPNAIAWAEEHVADMLGKDGQGGKLADSTREMIRQAIATALESHDSDAAITEMLARAYAFSPERAELIARTEVRDALGNGALIGAKAVGMQEKRWLLSNDENKCALCIANAEQGWIPIGQAFVSGAQAPTQHPRCQCDAAYRRKQNED